MVSLNFLTLQENLIFQVLINYNEDQQVQKLSIIITRLNLHTLLSLSVQGEIKYCLVLQEIHFFPELEIL